MQRKRTCKPLTARGQRRKDRRWLKTLKARPIFTHYATIDNDDRLRRERSVERTDVLIAPPTPKKRG